MMIAAHKETKSIHRTAYAFAALMDDGSVKTWPNHNFDRFGDWGNKNGGDSSAVSDQLKSGVVDIYANKYAFAALKSDGSLIAWGNREFGGDSRSVSGKLKFGVVAVSSTDSAFAALKSDGSVVTWGSCHTGGNSYSVREQIKSGVVALYSSARTFTAIKIDGARVTWGDL